MNEWFLPTFSPETMRGGNLGPEYEPGALEMHLAAQVLLDIQSFMGSGLGNVYPYSPNVVAPRVIELVVEHLRDRCGYFATYVMNDHIVVIASANIVRDAAGIALLQQQIYVQDGLMNPDNQ